MVSKEEISLEVKSWVGTPFHHQGRKKSVGVDCIGLLVGVAKNLKIKSDYRDTTNHRVKYLHEFDRVDYSPMPNRNYLVEVLGDICAPVKKEELGIGDIILFTFKNWPQHVGIVCEETDGELFFVHASQPVKSTIISRYDTRWKMQTVGYFRFPLVNFIQE